MVPASQRSSILLQEFIELSGCDYPTALFPLKEKFEDLREKYRNTKQNNMEKTITMSLETALEFYKTTQDKILKDWLICNFGRDALEKKEGFTWEESFAGDGYFISDNSYIVEARIRYENSFSKQFFKTKNQALSALAFAQLSHIVNRYNKGKAVKDGYLYEITRLGSGLESVQGFGYNEIAFYDKEDSYLSLNVNRELWKQYWML